MAKDGMEKEKNMMIMRIFKWQKMEWKRKRI